jgi:hypothetical protein
MLIGYYSSTHGYPRIITATATTDMQDKHNCKNESKGGLSAQQAPHWSTKVNQQERQQSKRLTILMHVTWVRGCDIAWQPHNRISNSDIYNAIKA